MWLPKIKQGGIIAGHDYLEACFMGVVNAVNETFGKPDKTYKDTSWLKFLEYERLLLQRNRNNVISPRVYRYC
jgi:hypothetical protein